MMKNNELLVIHEHKALIGDHFDLRIALNGVAKTWIALGKIIFPIARPVKLFHGSDHPLEIMDFHGVVNDGSFGSGIMAICHESFISILDYCENQGMEFMINNVRHQLLSLQKEGQDEWLLAKAT